MNDFKITFELRKSGTDAGYDFIGVADDGGILASPVTVIARNIPTVKAALDAIREAFTAPLVDKDRLDIMEESTAAIGGLLDRVADLESRLEATRAQLGETNQALIRVLTGGSIQVAPGAPPGTVPNAVTAIAQGRVPAGWPLPQEPPAGAPRIVEEGFAGTFRRPLADYVHGNERGHFAGGAFRPGGARAKQGLEPPQAPGVGDDEP